MENNGINGYIGQAGLLSQLGASKKQAEKKDLTDDQGRDFAQLLNEEETKTDQHQNQSKESKLINNEAKTKEEKKQQSKKQLSKEEEIQNQLQKEIKAKLTKMSSMLNYLYNLMYKNPDALSMMEKKAAGLDKIMQQHDVELKEFKKMLGERGLKMSDLSFDQMAKLAQRKTKASISTYLDKIAQQKKAGTDEEVQKKTLVEKGKENRAVREGRVEESPRESLNLTGGKQAQETQKSEMQAKAREALKKREVIDQIVKHIDVRNLNNRTELVMKLNPEYLGDLKMKINFEEGRMKADFETTSKEIKEMLNESAEELVEVFNGKGLKLASAKATLVDKIE